MTASEHRARARAALAGNWPWAVLTSLVAMITGAIANSGANFEIQISETDFISLESIPEAIQTLLVSVLGYSMIIGVLSGIVATIVQLIIGGVTGIGYRKYLLNLVDGQEATFEQMFSQFHRLGQALLVRVIRWAASGAIPVALLTALVPMLAAGLDLLAIGAFVLLLVALCAMVYVDYGLAVAEFIMADEESCGAVDALKRSWTMMDGRRWDLFVLELSFIGWSLLTIFTFGLGGLVLTPYVQAATASFYRELRPKIVPDHAVNDGYSDYAGITAGCEELPGGTIGIEE